MRRREQDQGFTLIEFVVAMSIFVVLLAVAGTAVVSTSSALSTTREVTNLNEEARQALNRMARDIRQASGIVTAVDPDGPAFSASHVVAVRFKADYDGDGCVDGLNSSGTTSGCLAYNASNPEDVTYCFEPSSHQLYIIDDYNVPAASLVSATSTSCSGGQPLLAGNVGAFVVQYRSNNYRYDANADGVTTWGELDAAGPPVGNDNGALDTELSSVDSVVLTLTMSTSGHQQVYRTQVDLRNLSQ
jgi:prepilin-type N-terminal cleavage/methylation domain-containing protein